MANKNISLVLGGGGARCFAHLGVIDALSENKIDIGCVVGSSTGALMAAMAANKINTKKIKEVFYRKDIRAKWLMPKIPISSFMSQDVIGVVLDNLLENKRIEKSNIKLKIVATDFRTGKAKVFKRGSIKKAVMASMAFPGIYKPVRINNIDYVDGGISNNVPSDVCKKLCKGLLLHLLWS